MWEETFGPVIPIGYVKDVDEAIQLANKSRFGLDSCVFTNDINLARKVAKRLEDGEVTINAAPRVTELATTHSGATKIRGWGREGIGYSIEEMTRDSKQLCTTGSRPKVWGDQNQRTKLVTSKKKRGVRWPTQAEFPLHLVVYASS